MLIRTHRRFQALTASVLFVCVGADNSAFADPPLIAGDGPTQTESRNKQYVAVPGPGEKSTIVFRVAGSTRQELWRMPEWQASSDLSDDGEYLTLGYYRDSHLDRDYKPDVPMLRFYRRGALIRAVPLKEVIRDFKNLRRTTSHFYWGDYVGHVDLHRYAVDTVEGRRLVYDVTTGQLVSNTESPKPVRQPVAPRKQRRSKE